MQYNVIMIGAGHNGLTAAAYLAKAGRKVLMLEQREIDYNSGDSLLNSGDSLLISLSTWL
ncbi:MAG: NAD(P)-binding protein [Proteobacteria bacterium]|nr:NAD(P)-binding protein [Pseudomonadota bacterium]